MPILSRAVEGFISTPILSFQISRTPKPASSFAMAFRHYAEIQSQHPRRALSGVLMRSGTSKGLFVHRDQLPASQADWIPIILSAMGSACGDKRQLDGIGGATSTTSKVAIVSKSKRPAIDVDYQFAQVAVGDQKIDMTGNCGNMASGVGPFALDEGLVTAEPGQTEIDIRVYNTNTGRVLVETVQVNAEGKFLGEGKHRISGFAGSGSLIKVNFVDPAGSMTGELFPSGHRQNDIKVNWPSMNIDITVRATLIDAANPFIFIEDSTLPDTYHQLGPDSDVSLELIEAIRREGAVLFGLAPDVDAAKLVRGTPKIAVLSTPKVATSGERQPNIDVTAFSMGKVHPSLQLTGAVCLGTAVGTPGTIASKLAKTVTDARPASEDAAAPGGPFDPRLGGEVCIGQRSGQMLADVKLGSPEGEVTGVSVYRTAQRLFEGNIMLQA